MSLIFDKLKFFISLLCLYPNFVRFELLHKKKNAFVCNFFFKLLPDWAFFSKFGSFFFLPRDFFVDIKSLENILENFFEESTKKYPNYG